MVLSPSACRPPGASAWVAAYGSPLSAGGSGASLGAWAAVSGVHLGLNSPGGRGLAAISPLHSRLPPHLALLRLLPVPSSWGGLAPGYWLPGGWGPLACCGVVVGGWVFGVGGAWGRVDGWWVGVCAVCGGATAPVALVFSLVPWWVGLVPPWILGPCLDPVALGAVWWVSGALVALGEPLAEVALGMGGYLGIR